MKFAVSVKYKSIFFFFSNILQLRLINMLKLI